MNHLIVSSPAIRNFVTQLFYLLALLYKTNCDVPTISIGGINLFQLIIKPKNSCKSTKILLIISYMLSDNAFKYNDFICAFRENIKT